MTIWLAVLVLATPHSAELPAACAFVAAIDTDGEADEVDELRADLRQSSSLRLKRAARRLGELGADAGPALPDLLTLFGDRRTSVRRVAAQAVAAIVAALPELVPAIADRAEHENRRVREAAARSLGELGRAARTALPTLRTLCGDDSDAVRAAALKAIVSVETDEVALAETLAPFLGDSEPASRAAASEALVDIGAPAIPAIAPMVEVEQARASTLRALAHIGEPALPVLLPQPVDADACATVASAAIASRQVEVYVAALACDEGRADAMREARAVWCETPFFARLDLDAFEQRRVRAELRLRDAELALAATLTTCTAWTEWMRAEELYSLLAHPHAAVRETGAWALGLVGPGPGVGVLRRALLDPSPWVRGTAVWAVGCTLPGGPGEPFSPEVAGRRWATSDPRFDATPDPERSTPEGLATSWSAALAEAARALDDPMQTGRAPELFGHVLPELVAGLRDEEVEVRILCMWTLARAGPHAAPAVPDVIEALHDEAVAWRALQCLGSIGPAAREARDPLIAFVERGEDPKADFDAFILGLLALEALTSCAAEAALPYLVARLDGAADDDERAVVLEVLARAGPAARVLPLWGDSLEVAPELAAAQLVRYGADGVPPLVHALGSEDDRVRGLAICALGELGPVAAPAIPALEELAGGESAPHAVAARQALEAVLPSADGSP